MPHLHIDIDEMSVQARIVEANRLTHGAKRAQVDELKSTQEQCAAIHQALDAFVPGAKLKHPSLSCTT